MKKNSKPTKKSSKFQQIKEKTINTYSEGSVQSFNRQKSVSFGFMSESEELKFLKSTRNDYGREVSLTIPQGYHAQAKKAWEMYDMDRLFRFLIDRTGDFGANGFEWELPIEIDDDITDEQINDVKKEKKVWNKWAKELNKSSGNVLPGINEINKWLFKNILLTGMAPLEWEYNNVIVDGITYLLPTKMTMYNALSTVLDRDNAAFASEEVYIKLANNSEGKKREYDTSNQANSYSRPNKDSTMWRNIKLLGQNGNSKTQGFVIKYNWSPADNTAQISGTNVTVGQGLYPTPPFLGLYPILILRQQLVAADVSILDGVINYIIDWSIGDDVKDDDGNLIHEPRPEKKDASGTVIEKSTMAMVKEMITSNNKGNVMQLFHPYYYKMDIKMPDTALLLSADKYTQSIVEILYAFGMILSPTDRTVDFTEINTANFEQIIDGIRINHIKMFWESLCAEIVERNGGALKIVPNMIFNPLNTQNDKFRQSIYNLAKIGKVSTEALHQAHKLDTKTEVLRIADEIKSGTKDITDKNVPISFVQSVAGQDGKPQDNTESGNNEGGRPQGVEEPDKRKPKSPKEE